MSVEMMASELIEKIKAHIDQKLEPLIERISVIEQKDYVEFIDTTITAAVSDAIKSIELPTPENGKDGKDGPTIEDLQPVINEAVNSAVSKLDVPAGEDGDKGDKGEPGEPGRDALDIDVLPEIIEEKSYPYGTYAKHKGGLWKAVNHTRGMRGWECIVDGVDSIDVDYDGERGVSVVVSKSSGDPVKKSFEIPALIDRGVYREGTAYKRFDAVTFGGSVWFAQDGVTGKPGIDSAWRLSVKKGRDAKPVVKSSHDKEAK